VKRLVFSSICALAIFTAQTEANSQCSEQELNYIMQESTNLNQVPLDQRLGAGQAMMQRILQNVSPQCIQYVQAMQAYGGGIGGPVRGGLPQRPPKVIDHGGGTYTGDGVTCGPSGCGYYPFPSRD
jgi:hypothetical protein